MDIPVIRLLRADEIECRAAAVSEKGISLLLYKDARVDQRILDETFGAFGWKRSHQSIDGNLYCTVEIKDERSGEWIGKQDVGVAGHAEKEKTQASDSFKRACFNWGIGRELYSVPFIWIPASKVKIQKKGDKWYCNERFSVVSITYNAVREIAGLEVADGKGETVYSWKENGAACAGSTARGLSEQQISSLEAELRRTGVNMETVQERYRIQNPENITEELYEKVMRALAKTKSVKAA